MMGNEVKLVNPAKETALAVQAQLMEQGLLSDRTDSPEYRFFVSDDPEKFRETGSRIISLPMTHVKKISIENY